MLPDATWSELVFRPRLGHSLAGSLCPNADLGDGRRLDEASAGRFAVITTACPPDALRAVIERSGGIALSVEQDTELHRWLWGQRASAAVLRPDATVMHAGRDLAAAPSRTSG